MTYDLGFDLCIKPMHDEETAETLWIVFQTGHFQTPLLILHDLSVKALAGLLTMRQRERKQHEQAQ